LEGNTCRENGQCGIVYVGSAAGTARKNVCMENAKYDIYVTQGAQPVLENNTANKTEQSEAAEGGAVIGLVIGFLIGGPTGFPSGLDKIHVVLWDSNDQEVGRDTVVLKVQDNVQHITEWVIPNDWRIDGETLTTPTPEEPLSYPEQSGKTLGPQIEGTGRDYNVYNKGDAYTRAAVNR